MCEFNSFLLLNIPTVQCASFLDHTTHNCMTWYRPVTSSWTMFCAFVPIYCILIASLHTNSIIISPFTLFWVKLTHVVKLESALVHTTAHHTS